MAIYSLALYLPQTILATCTTMDWRTNRSLRIIVTHPSLLLLPIITVYTFTMCREYTGDIRVKFRKV